MLILQDLDKENWDENNLHDIRQEADTNQQGENTDSETEDTDQQAEDTPV